MAFSDNTLLLALCLLAAHVAAMTPAEAIAKGLDPDVYRNTSELIESRGFKAEAYDVTTSDGYILGLFRIPCTRAGQCGGPPVLLVHALLCSSDQWVMDSPEHSLAYVLADAGFDVWIANKRGNTYSSRHLQLKVHSREFWAFSWDQVGNIDIPEQIDFIIKTTGYSTVGYVGHSEGTTSGFVAASNPVTAGKINSMAMLAPITNLTELSNMGLIRYLMRMGEPLIYSVFGHRSFLTATPFLKAIEPELCHFCPKCCADILFFMCGFSSNSSNYDMQRFEVYYAHTPAGTSVQNMVHWVQAGDTTRFQAYNFGKKENREKYNQEAPPQYYLGNLPMPVALYGGGRDTLATPENVEAVSKLLPEGGWTLWSDPTYEHLDFTWGLDAKDKLFPLVVEHVRKGAKLH